MAELIRVTSPVIPADPHRICPRTKSLPRNTIRPRQLQLDACLKGCLMASVRVAWCEAVCYMTNRSTRDLSVLTLIITTTRSTLQPTKPRRRLTNTAESALR